MAWNPAGNEGEFGRYWRCAHCRKWAYTPSYHPPSPCNCKESK